MMVIPLKGFQISIFLHLTQKNGSSYFQNFVVAKKWKDIW